MKTIQFKQNGGSISVEVKAGNAQPGAYSLVLWEADYNKILLKYEGNFINNDDDKYQLLDPAGLNNEKVLACNAAFTITPPIRNYNLDLLVFQDGNEIGSDSYSGTTDSQTAVVQLFIKLEEETE